MQATRQRILDHLRTRRGATVRELASVLDLTTTGVRQHLVILEQDGLVACEEVRGRVGRPAYRYSLTTQGDALFPKSYAAVANAVLEEVHEAYGMAGLQRLVRGVARRLAHVRVGDREPAIAGVAPADRIDHVVELFREQGIVADWERAGDAFLLHERTCPYPEVAREHSVMCAIDVAQVSQLTGMDVRLQACQVRGDACCTYRLVSADERAPERRRTPAPQ